MNINCTSNCIYQLDGKCTFNELTMPIDSFSYENDCPYFTERNF